MLGVQIKSNYRQCGPSASLRKDTGDTDGYLMFLLLKTPAVSEVTGEDLRPHLRFFLFSHRASVFP